MTGDFFMKLCKFSVSTVQEIFLKIYYTPQQGKQILMTETEKDFFYYVVIHGVKIILHVS